MAESLVELLGEPLESVIHRERRTLEDLLCARGNRVVLFGSGNLGRRAADALRGIGIRPLAFSDNNQKRWGTQIDDISVLPPKEAAALYGENAVFLVTIWNEFHWFQETKHQLLSYGCDNIAPCSSLHWRFPETFLPCLLNDLPSKLYKESNLILKAAGIWADDISRTVFEANIRLRALAEFAGIPGRPSENTYLPLDLVCLSDADRFLDCGATGGEMVQDLIIKRGSGFDLFCALEADNISFPRLEAYRRSLPDFLSYARTSRTTELFDLNGRVAIITGGAGLLGYHHGVILALAGAHVVLIDLASANPEARAKQLTDNYGSESLGVSCDITCEASLNDARQEILEKFGRIDILINNAANNPKVEDGNMAWSRLENFPLQSLGCRHPRGPDRSVPL